MFNKKCILLLIVVYFGGFLALEASDFSIDDKVLLQNEAKEWLKRADKFYAEGKLKKAKDCYQMVFELDKENEKAKLMLEKLSGKMSEQILDTSKGIIDPLEDNVDYWFAKGKTLYKQRKFRKAIECFKISLELVPGDVRALDMIKKCKLQIANRNTKTVLVKRPPLPIVKMKKPIHEKIVPVMKFMKPAQTHDVFMESKVDPISKIDKKPVEDIIVTVKKGDTLSEISKRYTGTIRNVQKIAKANRLKSKHKLAKGQTLVIPKELLPGYIEEKPEVAHIQPVFVEKKEKPIKIKIVDRQDKIAELEEKVAILTQQLTSLMQMQQTMYNQNPDEIIQEINEITGESPQVESQQSSVQAMASQPATTNTAQRKVKEAINRIDELLSKLSNSEQKEVKAESDKQIVERAQEQIDAKMKELELKEQYLKRKLRELNRLKMQEEELIKKGKYLQAKMKEFELKEQYLKRKLTELDRLKMQEKELLKKEKYLKAKMKELNLKEKYIKTKKQELVKEEKKYLKSKKELENKKIQLDTAENKAATHYDLALTYWKKGLMAEAMREYKMAVKLSKKYLVYDDHGLAEGVVSKSKDIIDKRAFIIAELHYKLGAMYQKKGKYEDALVEYKKTLKLNKNHAGALFNSGMIYELKGNITPAIAVYEHICALKNIDDKFVRMATERISALIKKKNKFSHMN